MLSLSPFLIYIYLRILCVNTPCVSTLSLSLPHTHIHIHTSFLFRCTESLHNSLQCSIYVHMYVLYYMCCMYCVYDVCVCMYVLYMFVCVCVCVCSIHVHMYVLHVRMYELFVCVCMHTIQYVNTYTRTYVHTTYTYIHMQTINTYARTYVCKYLHIELYIGMFVCMCMDVSL